MSIAGELTGKKPTLVSREICGAPSTTMLTSVEVPPMSRVRKFVLPTCSATLRAPETPPAGPERIMWTGCPTAASTDILPPSERSTSMRPAG